MRGSIDLVGLVSRHPRRVRFSSGALTVRRSIEIAGTRPCRVTYTDLPVLVNQILLLRIGMLYAPLCQSVRRRLVYRTAGDEPRASYGDAGEELEQMHA